MDFNDGAAQAAADVAVAVGKASDFCKLRADFVMSHGAYAHFAGLFVFAQRLRSIVRQNYFWALGYNLTAVPLAAAGLLPPYLAAVGMSGSSLLVLANAWRLRR